jgi:ribosomal protein S27AE
MKMVKMVKMTKTEQHECPKCGGDFTKVRYCGGNTLQLRWYEHHRAGWSTEREHLHRTCSACGYEITESCRGEIGETR